MTLPLFHNSLPVAASIARRIAEGEFETAKTTPLMTIGAEGEAMPAVHPIWGTGTLSCPAILQAVMDSLEGATIHRVPAPSCQLPTAPLTPPACTLPPNGPPPV